MMFISTKLAKKIRHAQSVGTKAEKELLVSSQNESASKEAVKEYRLEGILNILQETFILMITGHRPDKLPSGWKKADDFSENSFNRILMDQLKLFISWLFAMAWELPFGISGMAAGADMIFALAVRACEKMLYAAVPCAPEEQRKEWNKQGYYWMPWPEKLQKWHQALLEYAGDRVSSAVSRKRSREAMGQRNLKMVKACAVHPWHSCAIALWDGSNGGTANCVRDLFMHDVNVLFLPPKAYKNAFEILKEQVIDLVRAGKLNIDLDIELRKTPFDYANRVFCSDKDQVLIRHAYLTNTEVCFRYHGVEYPAVYGYSAIYMADENNKPCRYYVANIPGFKKGDDIELVFHEC